jgi:hypothetical protein
VPHLSTASARIDFDCPGKPVGVDIPPGGGRQLLPPSRHPMKETLFDQP